MFPVKGKAGWCGLLGALRAALVDWGFAGLGVERETTVDQALIRWLATAFPCLRLGAFLGLEDGRRACGPAT